MNKKVTGGDSPGIIYEDVYYFENLDIKRGRPFFTVGVWQGKVARVDVKLKSLLGKKIEAVKEQYKKRKYQIHKI